MNSDLKILRVGVKRRLESPSSVYTNSGGPGGGPLRKHLNSGGLRSSSPSGSSSNSLTTKVSSLDAKVSSPASTIITTNNNSSYLTSSFNESRLSMSKIRQIVFNMSMCKLSRFRQTPDPSLLRSVLICNTLKRLEKELDREGIRINFGPNGVSFLTPNTSPSPVSPTPSLSSPSPSSASLPPSPISKSDDSSKAFALDGDGSPSGRLTPFPTHPADDVSNDSALESRFDLNTSSSSSSSSSSSDSDSGLWSPEPPSTQRVDPSSSWSSHSDMSFENEDISDESGDESLIVNSSSCESNPSSSQSLSPSPPSLHELRPPLRLQSDSSDSESEEQRTVKSAQRVTNPASGSSEEIFGDIDLSLYDFDLLSPISAPNEAIKLTPVSAEELMRSLVPNQDVVMEGNNSFPSTSSSSHQETSSLNDTLASPEVEETSETDPFLHHPIASSSNVPPSSPSSMNNASSCATQSSQTSASVVASFSKMFMNKKDNIQYLDDIPAAIS